MAKGWSAGYEELQQKIVYRTHNIARRIGILGGTFNPIHLGHMDIAWKALHALGLERVGLLTNSDPPHKQEGMAAAEHRLEMVRLAVRGYPGLEAWDYEANRPGKVYTIDTLELLNKAMAHEDIEWVYILGADAFLDLFTWKSAEEVIRLCSFAVFCRPGVEIDEVEDWAHQLRTQWDAQVQVLPHMGPDISSDWIRAGLCGGRNMDAWLPAGVGGYIRTHGLYTQC
ncbi:putative nicotinate-nucleotide adenylyltransferase [Bacteroidia bacterium]|nr:putative nicotinate-nucleotide adenylyltransferase [Bacteroidia bacterium]